MSNGKKIPASASPSEIPGDDLAAEESTTLGSGIDYEKLAEDNQAIRREIARDHIGLALVISIWIAFILVAAGTIIFAWHMVMPACWRWLQQDDLAKIQEMISHIVIGVVIGYLIKNKFV